MNLLNLGVSHGDDAFLIFGYRLISSTTTPENDEGMRNNLEYLFELYVNNELKVFEQDFGLEWTRVSATGKDFHYLQISGPGDFKMASDENFGDKDFWSTISFDENVLESNSIRDEL